MNQRTVETSNATTFLRGVNKINDIRGRNMPPKQASPEESRDQQSPPLRYAHHVRLNLLKANKTPPATESASIPNGHILRRGNNASSNDIRRKNTPPRQASLRGSRDEQSLLYVVLITCVPFHASSTLTTLRTTESASPPNGHILRRSNNPIIARAQTTSPGKGYMTRSGT